VDLLAIDRDGVGEVHLVEVKYHAPRALEAARPFLSARAPYRWLAFFRGTEDDATKYAFDTRSGLFISGQAGRIGLIEVTELAGDELGANVQLSAERFATPANDLAKAFSNSHKAQIQFGE
jgi:hypothetical protein